MKGMTGVATLPTTTWIGLDQALSWICFDASAELGELLDGKDRAVPLTEDQIRDEFQRAWRQLADVAGKKSLEIRGWRERARQRDQFWTQLSRDDLFNCRFLDIVLYPEGRTILISRHDRSHDGAWDSMWNQAGWDYTELVMRREDLLAFKSCARPKQVRRKTSQAMQLQAVIYAKKALAARSAAEVRKTAFLAELSQQFALTRDAQRQVWREATAERPDLCRRGRRKRAESNRAE